MASPPPPSYAKATWQDDPPRHQISFAQEHKPRSAEQRDYVPCPNGCEVGSVERCNLEQHRSVCSLEPVCCEMREFGCSAVVPRKDLATHMRESELQHLTGMAVLNLRLTRQLQQDLAEKDKKIAQLQEDVTEQRQLQTVMKKEFTELREQVQQIHYIMQHTALLAAGVCEVTFDQYGKRKRSNQAFFSNLFYSHHQGYKFELQIKNYSKGRNSIAPFFCLLTGEYDDQLPWLVSVEVRLELLNQAGNHHHVERTRSWVQKKENRNNEVLFENLLMTYLEVEKIGDGVQYMMNDCLKFRLHLTVRTVHLL